MYRLDKRVLILLCLAGTELALAVEAAEKLEKDGKKARVVSFPSWELFEEQSAEYKVCNMAYLMPFLLFAFSKSRFTWR